VNKNHLLYAVRSLSWVVDRVWAISDRAYAIVFGGVAIAFSFATFLLAVATGIPEYQAIAGFAAALTLYICLEAVYDKHTYFVFVSCLVIPSVASVTVAAITAGLPTSLILPIALRTLLPAGIALLLVMHMGEMFVRGVWGVFSLKWLERSRRDQPEEITANVG
jgi:hypothetical protein